MSGTDLFAAIVVIAIAGFLSYDWIADRVAALRQPRQTQTRPARAPRQWNIRLPRLRLPQFTLPQMRMPRMSAPQHAAPRISRPRVTAPRPNFNFEGLRRAWSVGYNLGTKITKMGVPLAIGAIVFVASWFVIMALFTRDPILTAAFAVIAATVAWLQFHRYLHTSVELLSNEQLKERNDRYKLEDEYKDRLKKRGPKDENSAEELRKQRLAAEERLKLEAANKRLEKLRATGEVPSARDAFTTERNPDQN